MQETHRLRDVVPVRLRLRDQIRLPVQRNPAEPLVPAGFAPFVPGGVPEKWKNFVLEERQVGDVIEVGE